ncbi:MAG: hypothetical protein M1827_001299 [Pycnora praestabilis]|nr:MAG: hypothetical protein M1827_001299 [Pycnora praestabilis]
MPHTAETFLPPLLNPVTGEEEVLIYTPQIDCPTLTPGSKPRVPKYGTWELTDHLIKQYSPLFHAATNVSAFIRAFTATPLLVHLKVSCPGQDHAQRYRRSAVDYALTSLRIAVERAPLMALTSLSLLPIHPMGLFYLRPMLGLGSLPNSRKRWAQIHELAIQMESYFSEPNVKTDQLKILHSFLEGLSPGLVRLLFQWRGSKGPCPLSLDSEVSSEPSNRLFGTLRPLRLSNLKYMELENILIDASQVSTFISRHRRTLKEFDFERVTFRTGDWDEALAPLTKISGSEDWKKKQLEVMDVPCVMIAEDQDSKTRRPNLEKTVISEENKIGGLWRLDLLLPQFETVYMALKNDAFPSSAAFELINSSLASEDAERKDAIKKGNAIFAFTLKNKEGQTESWYIDLKEKGLVGKGTGPEGKKTDVTLSLSDDDFGKLVSGKANAQRLFMSGKLKVKGDVMKATKMEPVLKKAQTKSKL